MKVTFLGITSLLFDDGEDQILFDCSISRPRFFKAFFGRFEPNLPLATVLVQDLDISRLRGIFVSHSHYDHVLDVGNVANLTGSKVYGSFSSLNAVRSSGVAENQLREVTINQAIQINKFKITILEARHSLPKWYNDDLGKIIDKPFEYPVKKETFEEGGSYSFLIEYEGKKTLIHPSFNFIENQYDNLRVDNLFFSIGTMSKAKKEHKIKCLIEVVNKTKPTNLVPIHWDDFFVPLWKAKPMFAPFDNTRHSLKEMRKYCENAGIFYEIMLPLDSIEI